MDKFEAAGLRRIPNKSVTPPTVAGCPIALECKVIEIYESGTHDVFVADIVNVTCQKELLDGEGKLHYENANLLAYAHGEYYKLGERVGRFGFSTDKGNRPTKGRKADDR
jgi:flavin reductase (DIM6/NTAB) family NADH-FMN oxidoreductase RutF